MDIVRSAFVILGQRLGVPQSPKDFLFLWTLQEFSYVFFSFLGYGL